MKKWSNRGKGPEIKMNYNSNRINTSNVSPKNKSSKIYNQKNSPRNTNQNYTNPKNEKIIHHSIKRNYDRDGNSIIRTEIVRELEESNDNNLNSRSIMNIRPNINSMPYGINNNYSGENQEIIYDENYEMISPRSYNTHFKNGQKYKKIEIQSRRIGDMDERISPRNGPIRNLKMGGISPVMLFNTPESEYEQQRSYYFQGRKNHEFNNPNINISQQMEMNQKRYTNYDMESPNNFSKYSGGNDFNTPDRCNDYDFKYFRNIPIEKIKEKKPYNQEKINLRNNNQFESSVEFDKNVDNTQERFFSIPDGEDELYDIIDGMATLIQSNVRGFLVRKKVLRYITLAIYYQSFCDKLQDILSSHVKSEIMEVLKNYEKNEDVKHGERKNETDINYTSNSNNIRNVSNYYYNQNLKKYNENKYNPNRLTEKEESLEYNIYKNSPQRSLKKDYSEKYLTNKISHTRKLKKETSFQNNTNSFNRYNKFSRIETSPNQSNRVFHCFIHSPCTKRSPHHRYYHEISSRTVNVKDIGSSQLNSNRICHKCDETSRIKKQDKFYITTTRERNEEEEKQEEEKEVKEEYINKYEIKEDYTIKENKDEGVEERKIGENKKYSQLSYNNIFTMRKTLEKDNYLSINIIKLPGKDDRSKSLTTKDISIQKSKSPNKISKVESINIKTSRVHRTEEEIEEEINRRVKITILEMEKVEKEKRKEEEEKEKREINQKKIEIQKEKERKQKEEFIKKERERKEKERKEQLEKERKQREEKIRKEREEKYLKEKEERNKREEQQRIEFEKQRKIREEQQRIEIERQRKIREEQQRIEIEKQRKIKEEQIRERERQRKIKEEQQRIERERQRKIREEQQQIEREKQRKIKEEQQRIEIEKQRKIKEEQEKREKEKVKNITQYNKNEIEQTTTTKRIETRNITKYTRTKNADNPTDNKTNIKTIKLNEEKKINMSDYILKKDCQKNLEEMKSKLEKEYQKKIEIEKNKNLEEKRRYEEKIEIINKREIEKIKEHQKRIEIERKKELDKEIEHQKKKEIELQKQNETEIKKKVQMELEKQQKIMKQKELEEKNQKLKQIKINKVFSYNLLSQDNKDKTNIISTKKIEIDIKTIEKNKKQAITIIKKFILSRGNHLIKLKKYFIDWRAKVKNLEIIENAKILQQYCREILEQARIKRVKNNWIKLSKKIFYNKRIKILLMLPNLNRKKRKIYELIRITKLNRIFSRRRFIHYIILIWYIYSKKVHKKRTNMKFLYENLLKTYMSLANDIFGNNQIENPSVQDAMYEVLTSNKFVSMHQDDVPLAKKHYEEMKRKKVLERQNKINNIRIEFEQKRMKNYYYSQEKVKSEENENSPDEKRNEELLNKYKQYKSMNRDLILQKKNRYINSVEKNNNSNEKENKLEEIKEIDNYENKGKYGLNKINNRINSEDNKRLQENKLKYQKIETNKLYSKPDEYKYEIKEQKNLGKSSITPINLNNRNYSKDYNNNINIDSSPKNNNLGYKSTYRKEEHIQENNNKYIPSYSYKRTEVVKYSKDEPKSGSQNKKILTTNTSSNNTRVVTSYYSNNKGGTNRGNENKIIYMNNDIHNKNGENNIDKKYKNKIEIKTSSSSDKDRNKITSTRSYKK